MWQPTVVDIDAKPIDKDKSKIRYSLGLEQSDKIVDYLSKKSYYVADNPDYLKIQITTFRDLLEVLTCLMSIALAGLKYLLSHFRQDITTFAEMFVAVQGSLWLDPR
jgi:hypothetical protein